LADPDESGQAVHSGGFAPALASLIFNSPCRLVGVRAYEKRQISMGSGIGCKCRKKDFDFIEVLKKEK